MNKETKFKVGDKAHKTKGYKFPCTIVGVFETIKGDIRVVGEMDEYGLLHIFNEDQLDRVEQKGMNKEKYNQIIDEVYNKWIAEYWNNRIYPNQNDKEQFINRIKTDPEFSEKWGLKIEERELSLEERKSIYETENTNGIEVENNHWLESKLKTRNIPTKQITLIYNNEIIESYE
ncbi:hypothetical protein UFOVP972_42 [uncultured Caudovirales phage]|uniref:Uncharacterized protein n=1 Tax=uncultured Caudovirales phage TaxID=2100421 RepID=A0A6J5PTB3_9CAUD|nr:hypothetical protein UFOVP972_42 [uncultured Caudovirales phage]